MAESHLFHLSRTTQQRKYRDGCRIDSNHTLFPVLKGMALSHLTLSQNGFREPHWHPNAHELSYCLEGRALMTIFSPGGGHDTFVIEPGTLAFVPMGYLHHVQNIGDEPVKMLLCFSHEMPDELNLSSTLAVIPAHALGATFGLESQFFKDLNAKVEPAFIGSTLHNPPLVPSWQTNRYKMNIDQIDPQIKSKGGTAAINNQVLMPALEGLTMYSLKLEGKGVREPHWHPNAHELNYLIKGRARIVLLSPGEQVDGFDMEPGDMSFLPQGYYHYIENSGDEPVHFAVFFNHTMPSDIGLSGSLGAYSNDLLASVFKVPVSYFGKLPKYQEDLFIVAGGG